MDKPIFIIGFMGCGKTTLAKELALKWNLIHRDSDEDIEAKEGMTIPEIFQTYGESYFRNLEKNWLDTINKIPAVISCGGGLPCFHDNIMKMKQIGEIVYLKISENELIERIKDDLTRPLLKNKEDMEIFELKNRREILYYSIADRVVYSIDDLILG